MNSLRSISPNRYNSLRFAASNLSKNYFSVDCDQSEILLRRPPGEVANPISTITSDYNSNHSTFSSVLAFQYTRQRPTSTIETIGDSQTFLTEIYQLIIAKKFKKLISYCKLLNIKRPNIVLIPYIGYMASICAQSKENELYFVKVIERSQIFKSDYSHFIHLLDEIRYIENNPSSTPILIKLLKFSVSDLNKVMSGGYRIVPGYYQKIPDFKGISASAATVALSAIRNKAAQSIPALQIETQVSDDTNDNSNKKRTKVKLV
ncbi:hypothetical protein M9Y10_038237 [Tritrichomonas musculus]|uniref:Uncharacterized protein n=1 Tax=Tritrichomonas musculus TaxID=1915356 RepID=A0ABR2K807_9EUKA